VFFCLDRELRPCPFLNDGVSAFFLTDRALSSDAAIIVPESLAGDLSLSALVGARPLRRPSRLPSMPAGAR